MKKLKILALIPARGGSKGIPGKNIMSFCGKPLITWSIEQALKSRYAKNVYVTSDSQEILNISRFAGAGIIKRPSYIAFDRSPTEEALIHAIKRINDSKSKMPDIIVFLQATSPLRSPEDIDEAIKMFKSQKADSLFSGSVLTDFCVWKMTNDKMSSLTYDYKKRGIRQSREPYFLENGSIYIFKPEILKKYYNRLGGRIVFYPMPLWKSYEIDNLEDIETCEYYMKKYIFHKR